MKRILVITATILITMTAALTMRLGTKAGAGAVIGQPAPAFALKDLNGKAHSLADYRGKLSVVAFISTKCPVSNDYNERIRVLADDYAAKGVVFLGVNADKDESVGMMREHATKNNFRFTILKDDGNVMADAYGAVRTPEIYIIDGRGVLRYHGRVDNSRDAAGVKRQDVRAALDELLAGKEVSVTETKAFGCLINRAQSALLERVDSSVSAQGNSSVKLIKPAQYAPLVQETSKQGQVLVVNFWATWCGPCVAEFPEFIKLDAEYKAKGVRFIGISADEVADLQPKVVTFVKENKVGFEIFVQDVEDPQEMIDVVDKEWQGALPATFVYDRTGKIILSRYGIIDRDVLIQTIEKALKS